MAPWQKAADFEQRGIRDCQGDFVDPASLTSSSAFVACKDHAAREVLLQSAALRYVSLRNAFYAKSAHFQLGGVSQTGKISLPDDGPVS